MLHDKRRGVREGGGGRREDMEDKGEGDGWRRERREGEGEKIT